MAMCLSWSRKDHVHRMSIGMNGPDGKVVVFDGVVVGLLLRYCCDE